MPPERSWIERPPPKGKVVRSNRAGGATSPTAAAPLQPRFRHSRAGGNPATSPSAKSGTSRSEEHTSELQSLMRTSYAVFCLKKKKTKSHLFKIFTNTLSPQERL